MSDDETTRRRRLNAQRADLDGTEPTEVLPSDELLDIVSQHAPVLLTRGTRLGAYVIDHFLGEGGGGTVYAGHLDHSAPDAPRLVAVKVLHAEMVRFPTMIKRFAREAAAVTQIKHPNIVQIFECGEVSPGRPYYVMELLGGVDLRKFLKAHGRFTAEEALLLMEPVCGAVQAAHDAGFIHRDIKANNVMLEERDGQRVVKLLDFGIAKLLHGEAVGQGLTEPGVMLGTPHAMAPEQIRCERLDQRADVYALGVLLFQLLTGQHPFQADDPRQVALLHLQAPAPRPSTLAPVSAAVDAVVLRCLEKSRDRRFGTATELLEALRKATHDTAGTAPEGESPSPAVGVYFELVTEGDDFNDELMEDISNVLDALENHLASNGFALPLRTSNALLGVRRIDEGSVPQIEREQTLESIHALCATLEKRKNKHPLVKLQASLTLGEAFCRSSLGGEVEVVGGELLEIDTWTASSRLMAG
jgi:serine/threonine-protein kinase